MKKSVKSNDSGLRFDDTDITYCLNVKCDKRDCARNECHTENGVIYSFSNWECKNGKCEGWLEK